MSRPRAVRFHTPLRATHDGRCCCDIHFLPITQQERLTLTRRQLPDGFFNYFKSLLLLQSVKGRLFGIGVGFRPQSFQRIVVVVLAACQ